MIQKRLFVQLSTPRTIGTLRKALYSAMDIVQHVSRANLYIKCKFDTAFSAKGSDLICTKSPCRTLIRGLHNLDAPCKGVKARAACFLGRRPMDFRTAKKGFNWPVRNRRCSMLIRGLRNLDAPYEERFYSFRFYEKNGEQPRELRPSGLRRRFKTLQNSFFVTFPTFVPNPACGATHFFGCFEPVRKGCCTSDARPVLFGNGLPHCKLTEASYIQKGKLHVIFIAVGI